MNQNQKYILIAVVVVVVAMFIYPPFQAVRDGTVYNMGYGWIFSLSKRGYMTINVSTLIIQWIGVLVVGGIAFFLAKGSSLPSELSSKHQSKVEPPNNISQKSHWLNWKSLIIAFFIAFFLNIFAAAVAGTKPAKNIIWTVWWIYLTIEAWKYWKWKALLPLTLYFFVLTIAGLFLGSIGVEYHSNPVLILLIVTNIVGLIIFYLILNQARSSAGAGTSINEDTEIKNIIREAELRSAEKAQKNTATESEVKHQDEEFISLLKSSVRENRLDIIPDSDLIEICKRARSIEVLNNSLDIEFSKAIDILLEEIKRRRLSQDSTKPQNIYSYKNSFLKQRSIGGNT